MTVNPSPGDIGRVVLYYQSCYEGVITSFIVIMSSLYQHYMTINLIPENKGHVPSHM